MNECLILPARDAQVQTKADMGYVSCREANSGLDEGKYELVYTGEKQGIVWI
jgi:hypothetical protein